MGVEIQGIEIRLEKGHPCLGRAGELHETLVTEMGESITGLTIDERPVDENDASKGTQVVVTVYAYCAGEIDRQAVEGRARMLIDAFQPKGEIARVASEPSKYELYRQLTRIEQEVQALREAIYKLLPH